MQEPGTEPGAVLPAAAQNMKPSVKLTDKITCQDCYADTGGGGEAHGAAWDERWLASEAKKGCS